jgi:RHS repeat-associated protein
MTEYGSRDRGTLMYCRARYYEPGTGRFLSEDPSRMTIWYLLSKDATSSDHWWPRESLLLLG